MGRFLFSQFQIVMIRNQIKIHQYHYNFLYLIHVNEYPLYYHLFYKKYITSYLVHHYFLNFLTHYLTVSYSLNMVFGICLHQSSKKCISSIFKIIVKLCIDFNKSLNFWLLVKWCDDILTSKSSTNALKLTFLFDKFDCILEFIICYPAAPITEALYACDCSVNEQHISLILVHFKDLLT